MSADWSALALALGVVSATAGSDPARDWAPMRFRDKAATEYRHARDGDGSFIEARCRDSASGLIHREPVDLARTPILSWRWRTDRIYPGIDEQTRDGDDFPLRVYVVRDGGWRVWRTRAVIYVWSGAEAGPDHWVSPYTDRAHVFAVRRGAAGVGEWQHETRDVAQDFRTAFGEAPGRIDGVAVMSDCDGAGPGGVSAYGELRWSMP